MPAASVMASSRRDVGRRVDGPLVFCLLDAEGLPISGVIYDELTGRRTKFKLPIAGEAVA